MNAERKLLKRTIELCKQKKEENEKDPDFKESRYREGVRRGKAIAYSAISIALEANMPEEK